MIISSTVEVERQDWKKFFFFLDGQLIEVMITDKRERERSQLFDNAC